MRLLAEPAEFQRRLSICGHCEELRAAMRCGKCGCKVRIKARMAMTRCPKGLWNADRQPAR